MEKNDGNVCVLKWREHGSFIPSSDTSEEYLKKLNPSEFPGGPQNNKLKHLGINHIESSKYEANYYIGADWYQPKSQSESQIEGEELPPEENEIALVVRPKRSGMGKELDFLKMFQTCLEDSGVAQHLNAPRNGLPLYHIDHEAPHIPLAEQDDKLTPFLVLYFLSQLQKIVQRGLKKGYTTREETLRGRVRGKILVGASIREQSRHHRMDRTTCRYDEFTVDCAENRYLKRAFMAAETYLKQANLWTSAGFNKLLNYCRPALIPVDTEQALRQPRPNHRKERFHREYDAALRMAELIIKRLGNRDTDKETTKRVPPYWINMPLLFELYAFALLRKGDLGQSAQAQVSGNYGTADMAISGAEPYVIDAKYTYGTYEKYENKKREYNISDIRQLSAYARDCGIREVCGAEVTQVLPCVIVYPLLGDESPTEYLNQDDHGRQPIPGFKLFSAFGVRLPTASPQNAE